MEDVAYSKKDSFVNFTNYQYKEKYQTIELVILSIIGFVIPIFLKHPQIIIGAIINALLFRSALTMNFKRTIPLIIFPSIGALVGGVLFGTYTPFLLYLIPIIWIGNTSYVLIAKLISKNIKKNYGGNVLIASLVKSGFLFGSTVLLVTFFGFPQVFLVAMGIMQLYTALLGGTFAMVVTSIEQKLLLKK